MDRLGATEVLLSRAGTVPVGSGGFGAWADAAGRWQTRPGTDWSSGYAVGLRWLAGLPAAGPLAGLDLAGGRHGAFRAFRGWFGAAVGDVLCGDPVATTAVVTAAGALATEVWCGIVPLNERATERLRPGLMETSIDAVGPVVGLLARAAALTGDRALLDLATAHLRWHLRTLLRPDGSVAQYALLDDTGRVVDVRTGPQGLRPDSTWARSQSWALLAVAVGVRWLPSLRDELLATAAQLTAWWLAHAPPDGIPCWDFDAPPGDPLDTSAAAITASALLRLPGGRPAAERLVDALCQHVTRHGLQRGCYHRRRGLAPANELIWGDFHLLEALLILAGDLDPLDY